MLRSLVDERWRREPWARTSAGRWEAAIDSAHVGAVRIDGRLELRQDRARAKCREEGMLDPMDGSRSVTVPGAAHSVRALMGGL